MDWNRLSAVSLVLLACVSSAAVAQNREPDEVTRQLFRQYLTGGKIDSESIHAARHLVAVRGRRNGFWKEILAELQATERREAEVNCVTLLGRMLGYDAHSRRIMESGEVTALIPSVHLGPEVVDVLLERGLKADRLMVDHYVIALMRANTPEAKEFFLAFLQADAVKEDVFGADSQTPQRRQSRPMPSTVFHAAVGLAQLGELDGIDWLVRRLDQTHENSSDVEHAIPGLVEWRQRRMGICCLDALQQMFRNRKLTTKAEWEAWLKTVDLKSQPRHGIGWKEW